MIGDNKNCVMITMFHFITAEWINNNKQVRCEDLVQIEMILGNCAKTVAAVLQ